jgi:hypothetical protein
MDCPLEGHWNSCRPTVHQDLKFGTTSYLLCGPLLTNKKYLRCNVVFDPLSKFQLLRKKQHHRYNKIGHLLWIVHGEEKLVRAATALLLTSHEQG